LGIYFFLLSLPAGSTICSSLALGQGKPESPPLSLAKPVSSTANLFFNLQQSRPTYLLQPLTTDARLKTSPQTDLHPSCSLFPLWAAHRPAFLSATEQWQQKPNTATTDRSEDHPAACPQSHQRHPHRQPSASSTSGHRPASSSTPQSRPPCTAAPIAPASNNPSTTASSASNRNQVDRENARTGVKEI
jgi:hypothetical protein